MIATYSVRFQNPELHKFIDCGFVTHANYLQIGMNNLWFYVVSNIKLIECYINIEVVWVQLEIMHFYKSHALLTNKELEGMKKLV